MGGGRGASRAALSQFDGIIASVVHRQGGVRVADFMVRLSCEHPLSPSCKRHIADTLL